MNEAANAKIDAHTCAQLIANVAGRFGLSSWVVHSLPLGVVKHMLEVGVVAVPGRAIDDLAGAIGSPHWTTPAMVFEEAATLLRAMNGNVVMVEPGRYARIGPRPDHVPESVWTAQTEDELRMAMWIERNRDHPAEAMAGLPGERSEEGTD